MPRSTIIMHVIPAMALQISALAVAGMIIIIIPAMACIFLIEAAIATRCAITTGAIGPDNAHNMAGNMAGVITATANDMRNGVTIEQNTATAATISDAGTIATICTRETGTITEAQTAAMAIGR